MFVRSLLPVSWINEVSSEGSLNLCSAANDPIVTLGQIELYVRHVDLHANSIFIVAET